MSPPRAKVPAPTGDAITVALRSILGELVRVAVAEVRESEPLRPALLSVEQIGQWRAGVSYAGPLC